jgi:LmbE family N-acetylglucosaminyl deacetylase
MIFDPDPRLRWAFCMTHPDDEISICAWIKFLVDNGNEVFVTWTHSTPVREAEAHAAATLLGLNSSHLHFFGAPDRDVIDNIPELLPRFAEWMSRVQPDRVCCGAFEQGHIDHDSTNYLVNRTYAGPVFEIPFYHTYLVRLQRINRFADPRGEEVRQLTLDEQRFKKLIAKQYPSQNIWSVLLWYEVLQGSKLKRVELARTERMRLQTHRDFLSPNLPLRLAERVRRCSTWTRWEQAIRKLQVSSS